MYGSYNKESILIIYQLITIDYLPGSNLIWKTCTDSDLDVSRIRLTSSLKIQWDREHQKSVNLNKH